MNRAIVMCGLFAAAFAMSPASAAGDCSGEVIDVGGAGVLYYVITGDTPDAGWGYIEFNGVPGLQRGGVAAHGLGTDPCQTEIPEGPDFCFY